MHASLFKIYKRDLQRGNQLMSFNGTYLLLINLVAKETAATSLVL